MRDSISGCRQSRPLLRRVATRRRVDPSPTTVASVFANGGSAGGDRSEESAVGRSDASSPSMAQDIDKKRRTEIHAINGFVVEKGAEIGLPAPANAALVEAVTKVETGKAKQSLDLVRSI